MALVEIAIAVGIFALMIGLVYAIFTMTHAAAGQEFDPCFVDNDMFKRICDRIEIEKIHQELLERAREWNELHK